MIKMEAHIEEQGLNNLENVLEQAVATTGRKAHNLVKQATIWTVQSLKANSRLGVLTPISKKKRPIIKKTTIVPRKNGKHKKYKYKILHYKGSKSKGIPKGKPSYWLTNKKYKNSRIKIRYRGAGRAGWLGVLRKMGKPLGSSLGNNRGLRRIMHMASRYKAGGGKFSPYIEFGNYVSYIGVVAPTSLNIALKRTANRMRKQWERDLDKIIG